VLIAAVQNVEDHGYLMDLGVPGISGFLSFKDTMESKDMDVFLNRLHIGAVVLVVVKGRSGNGRVCYLSSSSGALQSTLVRIHQAQLLHRSHTE
jgi:rRNA biogenesis protein RRP5